MQLRDYIHTASTILSKEENAEQTIDALRKYLKRRGYLKLYPAILKGIQRELDEHVTRKTTKVILAREGDLSKLKSMIDSTLEKYNVSNSYVIIVDPTIIGGYIVKNNQTKVDLSYKTVLLRKYQSLNIQYEYTCRTNQERAFINRTTGTC